MGEEQKARNSRADDAGDEKRQRSKIAFPYDDLQAAVDVAQAIHSNVGNGQCGLGQLSAWMNQSVKSSGFRVQMAAARLFGVIESNDTESYKLAPLGRQIVNPMTARKAKADAFLNVPLFAALYKSYKDGAVPPPAAIEREIVSLGVAEKQKERARQIFERSAEQAGFFEHGKSRLVMPAVREGGPPPPDGGKKGEDGGGGSSAGPGAGGGGDGLGLDPLIMALLRKIPTTDQGWPGDKRLRWFKTFAMNVSEVYDGDQPVELRIDLPDDSDKRQPA